MLTAALARRSIGLPSSAVRTLMRTHPQPSDIYRKEFDTDASTEALWVIVGPIADRCLCCSAVAGRSMISSTSGLFACRVLTADGTVLDDGTQRWLFHSVPPIPYMSVFRYGQSAIYVEETARSLLKRVVTFCSEDMEFHDYVVAATPPFVVREHTHNASDMLQVFSSMLTSMYAHWQARQARQAPRRNSIREKRFLEHVFVGTGV